MNAFLSHFSNKQGSYGLAGDGHYNLSTVKPRYITHQPFVAGACYGALGKELAVLLFREQFPLMGLHSQKTVGGLELGKANGGLLHVGTGFQTVVATIKRVFQRDSRREWAAMVDCEVTKAAAGVECVAAQRAGGTGLGTAVATAATWRHGTVVGVGLLMHEEFAQEVGAAQGGKDELGVASLPTQSASPCPVFLGHGGGVDEAAARGTDVLHELFQELTHDGVVVLAVGVHADAGNGTLRPVGQGHTDDGVYPGHKGVGVEAQVGVAYQIMHIGVPSLGGPLAEAFHHGCGQRKGRCHSASNKAKAPSLGFDHFAIQTPGIHILLV